jgi:hypothetical protein
VFVLSKVILLIENADNEAVNREHISGECRAMQRRSEQATSAFPEIMKLGLILCFKGYKGSDRIRIGRSLTRGTWYLSKA